MSSNEFEVVAVVECVSSHQWNGFNSATEFCDVDCDTTLPKPHRIAQSGTQWVGVIEFNLLRGCELYARESAMAYRRASSESGDRSIGQRMHSIFISFLRVAPLPPNALCATNVPESYRPIFGDS